MERNRFAPTPQWLEIGPAAATVIAELLFTLLVLAQSGGTVFYRVTTKQTVDGVVHTYYHTENMQIGITLLFGVMGLAVVTLILAVVSRTRELWLMRFLLPANVLIFCGFLAQAFLRPQGLSKHLFTVLVGLIAGTIAIFLVHLPSGPKTFRGICYILIAFTVASMLWGILKKTNGSGAWFLGIQPGELFKLAILILAVWGFDSLRKDRISRLIYILTAFLMIGNLFIVNDYGNGAILWAVIVVVIFALGHPGYAFLMIGITAFAVTGGYTLLMKFAPNLTLTQKLTQRFSQALFFPLTNWTESSSNQNIRQALLSLIRGGLCGTGVASSDALYASTTYASYTDFTFPCAVSIFGIGYAWIVIVALCMLVHHASPNSEKTQAAHFQLYMGSILGSYFMIQSLFHIGGSLSAIPMTGVTLPFLSAGGTSMIVAFTALGCMVGLNLPERMQSRIRDVLRGLLGLHTENTDAKVSSPVGRKEAELAHESSGP